jgi:hypothetical protein
MLGQRHRHGRRRALDDRWWVAARRLKQSGALSGLPNPFTAPVLGTARLVTFRIVPRSAKALPARSLERPAAAIALESRFAFFQAINQESPQETDRPPNTTHVDVGGHGFSPGVGLFQPFKAHRRRSALTWHHVESRLSHHPAHRTRSSKKRATIPNVHFTVPRSLPLPTCRTVEAPEPSLGSCLWEL